MTTPGAHHAAARMGAFQVLIAGGDDESGDSLARLEIYDASGQQLRPCQLHGGAASQPDGDAAADRRPADRSGPARRRLRRQRLDVEQRGSLQSVGSRSTSPTRISPTGPPTAATRRTTPAPTRPGLATRRVVITATMTSGALPPGSPSLNGFLTGTPTPSGAYYFGVHLVDTATGHSVDQSCASASMRSTSRRRSCRRAGGVATPRRWPPPASAPRRGSWCQTAAGCRTD